MARPWFVPLESRIAARSVQAVLRLDPFRSSRFRDRMKVPRTA